MRVILAAFLALFLASCASTTPEPRVVTQPVNIAVARPCNPDLGPRPALLTKEQIKAALLAAPTTDDKVKIMAEQLAIWVGWGPKVEAGLAGCAAP
jgi:PBP1b-binding outer membrane lipoprotein LpoB